jgi:Ulp1 family protease
MITSANVLESFKSQINKHRELRNVIDPQVESMTKERVSELTRADSEKAQLNQEEKERLRLSAPSELARAVRSSKRKNKKEVVVSVDDQDTYLVYPVEENAQDAITICKGDLKRLLAPEFLNDNLIDLKIKEILSKLPEEKKKKVS